MPKHNLPNRRTNTLVELTLAKFMFYFVFACVDFIYSTFTLYRTIVVNLPCVAANIGNLPSTIKSQV